MNDKALTDFDRQQISLALQGISTYIRLFKSLGINRVEIFSNKEIYND